MNILKDLEEKMSNINEQMGNVHEAMEFKKKKQRCSIKWLNPCVTEVQESR